MNVSISPSPPSLPPDAYPKAISLAAAISAFPPPPIITKGSELLTQGAAPSDIAGLISLITKFYPAYSTHRNVFRWAGIIDGALMAGLLELGHSAPTLSHFTGIAVQALGVIATACGVAARFMK